jgi:hypothetical protein
MAKFPELSEIVQIEPVNIQIQFKTLVSQFDDLGEKKRKQKWLYPKRHPTIIYKGITKANGRTLWQFYLSRKGSYEAFNYFVGTNSYASNTYEGEYVGTGDGSTTVFNLPAKNSSSYKVYKDGVEQTGGGVDYTFAAGTGADGADKITFTAAPASGTRITYDFTGTLKIRCTFAEDMLDFETFYDRLVNMGIQLEGELNE